MGVFGQIYGSRVVVGLATPSSEQLGAIGNALVKMNKDIYGRFAKNRIAAAQINKSAAQGELDSARTQLKDFQSRSGTEIAKGVETTLKQLRDLPSGAKPALEAAGAITRIQDQMAAKKFTQEPTLFKGFNKSIGNADKLKNMLHALGKADITSQQESLNWMQNRYAVQKKAVAKAEEQRKAGKITEKQLNAEKKVLTEYKDTYDEFNIAVGSNIKKRNVLNQEEKKLTENIKEGEKAVKKWDVTMRDMVKHFKKGMKKVAEKTKEVVLLLKKGMTEALTETTIALTAFYYKLQQNTQELIEFERELLNANSVFNITRSELFDTGEAITQFGQQFGMEMQNGATGLYQLASAGLSADDALTVLPETLKLSMAVQGDHNTISKLTAQTIMGFGMEFSDASTIVDKFAHSIQKSLIEYQDLSSAVKFALPFFTATGQSIDQLLGALEILTNRALEAGIAGRGLRQALSEFAEGADDNTVAFRKLGVEILNTDGSMKQLTEIAQEFSAVVGDNVINNTELLTTLIQDLNVRGATAFIHLVQSSDEFTQSVEDLENAGGELDEMVKIQNESLQAQIQILKNNVSAIFLMRDATYEGTDYMNAFHEAVSKLVEQFQALLVVETEQGYVLSEFGAQLQEIAIKGVQLFVELAGQLVQIIKEFTTEGTLNLDVLKLYTVPLKVIMEAFNALGPNMQRTVVYIHMLNKLIPFQAIAMMAYALSYMIVNREKLIGTNLSIRELFFGSAKNKLDVQSLANKNKEIVQEGWLIYLRNTSIKQLVIDIGLKIQKVAIEPVLAWWKEVEIKQTIRNVGWKIWENAQSAFWVMWTYLKIALTALLIAGMVALAAALWPIILAYAIYNSMITIAGIQTALFYIIATGGIIILVALIAGLVIAFYDMAKEMGVVGAVVHIVKDAFSSWGAKVREVWEERIYPFIYRVGMEFRALFGILGMMISNWWAQISESTAFQYFIEGIKKVAGVIKYVLMVPILILITTFKILWSSIKLVIDVFKALKNLSISGLKDAYKGFTSGIGNAISDLWEDLKFWAEGGYIKMQASGGPTAPMNIVGERGPELFIPSQSGQIINTRRTQEILHDMKRRAGAKDGMSGSHVMRVNTLIANKSVNKKTKMSVDTFAGVI